MTNYNESEIQIVKNKSETLNLYIAALSGWSGIMLIVYTLTGVPWLHAGDFSFPTAMAYHGILIPAWLLLVLAYFRQYEFSSYLKKLFGTGAVAAGILTGVGATLIHEGGFCFGTGLQIAGMILGEITVLAMLIIAFRHYFTISRDDINKAAWWTISIGLLAMSLATPLGHLAGAARDLGDKLPLLQKYAEIINLPEPVMIDGYIESHSHQILAAFLATAFSLPLIRQPHVKLGLVNSFEKAGLFIIAAATITQSVLYQYCAWSGWEPPDLFSSGPNGLPLDDLILILLGVGLLLVVPTLLVGTEQNNRRPDDVHIINRFIAIILLAYMISVVALGLHIEFHESYFGHGTGTAVGVPNDMAYIRAHLLFGFMIVPLVLGILLNGDLLNNKKQLYFSAGLAMLVVITGLVGTFAWTFYLDSTLIAISIFLTVLLLLVYAFQLSLSAKIGVQNHLPDHE